jgi:hypothetical protein
MSSPPLKNSPNPHIPKVKKKTKTAEFPYPISYNKERAAEKRPVLTDGPFPLIPGALRANNYESILCVDNFAEVNTFKDLATLPFP